MQNDFRILGVVKRILNQAKDVWLQVLCFSGPAILKNSTQTGKKRAMNALIRFKNVAPLIVIALSLVTARATTTDVIFSFEEDNGEYADTDLETDSAGNIYGTTVLGGDHGSGTVFQISPTPT